MQGIAAGVGFLGAGTILKLDEERKIKGLTTASSIWLAAALGTLAGLGEYVPAAAATAIAIDRARRAASDRAACSPTHLDAQRRNRHAQTTSGRLAPSDGRYGSSMSLSS